MNESLIELKLLGLLVLQPAHGPCAGGYKVFKPKSVMGNSRPGFEGFVTVENKNEILCDAPGCQILPFENKWVVKVHEWVPGPGYGDFKKTFDTLDQAFSEVKEYYFGDPSTMNPEGKLKGRIP